MKITVSNSGQNRIIRQNISESKNYFVREFDIVNSQDQDMTHIPNVYLRNAIMDSDFVFFLAFDVGGSHYG